jgi:IclR family transcriptional regulator, KDG regulon repressor
VVSLITAKSVVVAMTALARAAIEIGVRPGSDLSLHSTAQGKIGLAFSRHPLLKRALAIGLERYTDSTICDVARLQEEIDRIRRQGFALSPEESARGISAVAAPIFDNLGDGIATIAIVGLAQSIKNPPNPQHLAALLKAAERISRNLGFRVEPDEHPSNTDKEAHAPHA